VIRSEQILQTAATLKADCIILGLHPSAHANEVAHALGYGL
jgi:hypothetical protein